MRNQLRLISVFAVLAAFCLSGSTALGQKQTRKSRHSPGRIVTARPSAWEYKITGGISQEDMNKLGAEGWELAAIYAPNVDNLALYFKRLKR